MKSLEKAVVAMLLLGGVVSGLMLPGCASQRNRSQETLSKQDKDLVAAIESQKARGDLTPTEAALEKDSVKRDHLLRF